MRPWTLFWGSRSVNALAVEVTIFTLPVLATVVIGGSPGEVAAIVAIELLAGLAGPLLLAGQFDTRPTRAVLAATDVARAATVVLIPLAALTVGLSVPLLAVVAFLLGVLRFTGAGAVFVATPRLVPDAGLERANAQLEAGRRVAGIGGPLIAGGLVSLLGAVWAPTAEALLLLATAAALVMVPRLPPADGGRRRLNGLAAIADGVRALAASPALRAVTLSAGLFNAVVAGAMVLEPLLVLRELAVHPTLFGVGVAIGACGGIAGAAVTPFLLRRFGGPPVVMPGALLVAGISELPLIAWPGGSTSTGVVFAITQFVSVAAVAVFVVPNGVIRLRATPKHLMGRTVSAYMLLTRGIAPAGAAVFGGLAESTTVRTAFVAVVAVEVAAAGLLFMARDRLRNPALGPQDTARATEI